MALCVHTSFCMTWKSKIPHNPENTKAAWFASVGYTRQNWEELRDDLLTIATSIGYRLPWGYLMIAEHSMVVLTSDRPMSGLFAGDVGPVVHAYANGSA